MKAIMISIKPKWVEKILNKEKTIEIRKTRPKCKLPCKVYIYCVKQTNMRDLLVGRNGKVVGEFTLTKIDKYKSNDVIVCGSSYQIPVSDEFETMLKTEEIEKYGNGKPIYLWHIKGIKDYGNNPKTLSMFLKLCPPLIKCEDCKYRFGLSTCHNILKRAPQSWCYVEGI